MILKSQSKFINLCFIRPFGNLDIGISASALALSNKTYEIHSNILPCTQLCGISILLLQLLISLRSHTIFLTKYPVNTYGGVLYRYIFRPYWEFWLLFRAAILWRTRQPPFWQKWLHRKLISGVLETRWAVLLAGLYNNKLKRNSIGDHFLEFFCKFQRTFNKFCKDFVFSNAVNC